jgi:hypothetical protein
MRKWFPALALLGVVAAGWVLWRQHSASDTTSQAFINQSNSTSAAVSAKLNYPGQPAYASAGTATPSGSSPAIASATMSAAVSLTADNLYEPEFTNFPPETVLENVAHAIRDYASMFGSNPVGTNPEITAALDGNNPRQANFINPEAGMRINGNGELVDAWGTPYFFHQLSGTDMEIHSAGPDRMMWTHDDLITK